MGKLREIMGKLREITHYGWLRDYGFEIDIYFSIPIMEVPTNRLCMIMDDYGLIMGYAQK